MLEWTWEMVGSDMRNNQYGGQKGCGTEHFLAHMWTGILEDLEDSRGAVSVVSLDFAKVFNRLDHSLTLTSHALLGASTKIIAFFASFPRGTVMRVKVGDTLSTPRPVNGGVPQESCAGIQMYTVGIDDMDANIPPPPDIHERDTSQQISCAWVLSLVMTPLVLSSYPHSNFFLSAF